MADMEMKIKKKVENEVTLTIENQNDTFLPQVGFHKNMAFFIILGQCFGLMPIQGVNSRNINRIHFKWFSFKTAYSFLNLAGSLITAIFCIVKFAFDGLLLGRTGTMVFYILNCMSSWQFIQISKSWSVILRQWCSVEMSMKGYGFLPQLGNMYVTLTATIMSLALVEHLLFITNAFVASKMCENFEIYPAEIYFGMAFPHVFTLVAYSHWKAALVEVCNILATVTWNFTDLFIILVSCSLSARFQQIAKRIKYNKTTRDIFWRDAREDYNKLSCLCSLIDEHLAPLVMISFVNNTYFICVQLYNSIKERIGVIEVVYFFYSFGFLLARTTAVTLFAAKINDESRKPLQQLHSVSSDCYSTEVSRFICQINSYQLGLTGSRFFTVTRSFLLKMAGTIVTFELMFLQFGPMMKSSDTAYNITHVCIK